MNFKILLLRYDSYRLNDSLFMTHKYKFIFQHKKTAKKLQDLMVQAENEANKAVGGNEMVNDSRK